MISGFGMMLGSSKHDNIPRGRLSLWMLGSFRILGSKLGFTLETNWSRLEIIRLSSYIVSMLAVLMSDYRLPSYLIGLISYLSSSVSTIGFRLGKSTLYMG